MRLKLLVYEMLYLDVLAPFTKSMISKQSMESNAYVRIFV